MRRRHQRALIAVRRDGGCGEPPAGDGPQRRGEREGRVRVTSRLAGRSSLGRRRKAMKTAAGLASLLLGLLATSALARPVPLNDAQMSQVVAGTDFTIVNEIANPNTPGALTATTIDPALKNSWGLSEFPRS